MSFASVFFLKSSLYDSNRHPQLGSLLYGFCRLLVMSICTLCPLFSANFRSVCSHLTWLDLIYFLIKCYRRHHQTSSSRSQPKARIIVKGTLPACRSTKAPHKGCEESRIRKGDNLTTGEFQENFQTPWYHWGILACNYTSRLITQEAKKSGVYTPRPINDYGALGNILRTPRCRETSPGEKSPLQSSKSPR